MCFHRTKLYKACGHTEFRQFMCNPVPICSNDDQSDQDSNGQVFIKGRFACGKQPQHVNDLDFGLCGPCRKTRYHNKGAGKRRAVLDNEQSHKRVGARVFLLNHLADEPKHEEQSREQPSRQGFLPEPEVKEPKRAEKSDDVDTLPADAMGEWCFLKQSIMGPDEEYRQASEELPENQPKASSLLDAIGNQNEDCAMRDRKEVPAINDEDPTKPTPVKADKTALPQPNSVNPCTLSHSVTKVRRDLNAAKGRVRSMIQAINGKSDVRQMINPIIHKSMVTSVANTLTRNREPNHPEKPQRPVAPKEALTKRPLPFPPYPDTRALSKPAKLQVLTKHQFHRLVPVPEESTSQALVLANSLPSTVVLRRAKAIKVRNLNAFHCPVMKPRFGLKRKVLAPPVPRHLTPPVAVPFSKFADLGRRRVSEAEWSFVV